MKKIITCAVVVVAMSIISNCSSAKKYTNKLGINDVNTIADLIDMSFGDGPNGPFDVKKTTSASPKLVIQNNTDRTITVKAEGPTVKTFVVTKGKNDSTIVKKGAYHFSATAPGTKGCEGNVTLEGFNEYTWIFIIKNN
jgi:hypothetical protein